MPSVGFIHTKYNLLIINDSKMKKLNHGWWTAILTCGLMSLASCAREDNPVVDDGQGQTPAGESQNIQEKSQFDSYIDMGVYAGDNFYYYATGTWLANNPLKEGQEMNGTMADQIEVSQAFVNKLVKDAADGTTQDPLLKQLYTDWNATTMDVAKKSLKAVLKGIDDVTTMDAMYTKMGELAGNGYDFPFAFSLFVNDHTVVPYLGIPAKPAYYRKPQAALQFISDLSDTEMAQIMVSVDKVKKMLNVKEGKNKGNAAGNRGIFGRHEHPYANSKVYKMNATRGADTPNLYTKVLATMGLDKLKEFRMEENVLYIGEMLSELTLDDLKNVMKYFVMARDIDIMPAPAPAENDTLLRTSIGWLANVSDSPLSLYMSNIYNKTVKPESYETAAKLVEEFRTAFKERIQKLTWMSDASKAKAIEKLEAMHVVAGWIDTEHPEWLVKTPQAGNFYDDVRDLFRQHYEIEKQLIGEISGDALMYATAIDAPSYEANATYFQNCNMAIINSINLTAPIYCEDKGDAYNLAILGATTIGHEMTHGFDSKGSNYDKMGIYNEWLDADSKANFEKLQQLHDDNFSSLTFWPNYYCNGTRTLAENIADLGGLCIAYDVLMKRLAAKGVTDAERDYQAREFFRAFAFAWMENFNQERADDYLNEDEHAAGSLRVMGNVYLMDEFYRVFNITRGILYLAPDKRFLIW